MPDELVNRRADNWRLQFTIADLAREDWGVKARIAAMKIEGDPTDNRAASARALATIKAIFESSQGKEAFFSEDLVKKMGDDPASEWHEWGRARKPISQVQLARLLKEHGIRPELISIEGQVSRGYRYFQFTDAWGRYL
jgi:hypothetical protein